jgi:hypothetical protein
MKFPEHGLLDHFVFLVMCVGASVQVVMTYRDGDKEWAVIECVVLLVLGAITYLTVPFATGTEETGNFHRFVSILLGVTVCVFLLACILGHYPWEEGLAWSLGYVIVGSALLLLFVLVPLSTLLLFDWLRR